MNSMQQANSEKSGPSEPAPRTPRVPRPDPQITAEEEAATRERIRKSAEAMRGVDFEAARRGARDLSAIVRSAGSPGRSRHGRMVSDLLLEELTRPASVQVRRQLLWMISEIGSDEAVEPVAALLMDEELRDDARMVLERIPGARSFRALDTALGKVPVPFRRALAVSLRARGKVLVGLTSQKLAPSRKTQVQPKRAPVT